MTDSPDLILLTRSTRLRHTYMDAGCGRRVVRVGGLVPGRDWIRSGNSGSRTVIMRKLQPFVQITHNTEQRWNICSCLPLVHEFTQPNLEFQFSVCRCQFPIYAMMLWILWNQQMMHCFLYLQFSNSSTSPELKTNKILGVYLTSSRSADCMGCPSPSPCVPMEAHHICRPVSAWVVTRSLLTQWGWDLWVGVGSSSLLRTYAAK